MVLIMRLILPSGAHDLCHVRSGELHQSHNLRTSLKMVPPPNMGPYLLRGPGYVMNSLFVII